ncbi:MAG: hypothetical protein ABJG41_03475 [Cyclobacteriaceae bacterium]
MLQGTYIPESYIVDNELMNITYTATPSTDYIDFSAKILFKQSMYLPGKFNDAIVLERSE